MLRQTFIQELEDMILLDEFDWSRESPDQLYHRLDIGLSRLWRFVHEGQDVRDDIIRMVTWLFLYGNAVESRRVVHHMDGDVTNNDLDNLVVTWAKENHDGPSDM